MNFPFKVRAPVEMLGNAVDHNTASARVATCYDLVEAILCEALRSVHKSEDIFVNTEETPGETYERLSHSINEKRKILRPFALLLLV